MIEWTQHRFWPQLLRLEDRLAPSFGPIGPEFHVNTYTTDDQRLPQVAADTDGDFVVVWSSSGQDGSYGGVYGQRYSAAGAPVGGEFRVNTFTTGSQGAAAVAMNAVGDFVVTWQSRDQDGSNDGVYAQRYSAAGVALGGEFLVNTYTTGSQGIPKIAMDAAGNFVVAWNDGNPLTGQESQDGSGYGVYAQRYNSAGAPLGGEFRVNTYTTNDQQFPRVAMDADGDFVVTWTSGDGFTGQDGSSYGVYAQRFSAAGAPLGMEFRVNTVTFASQQFSTVATNAVGDFVVAWQSRLQDGPGDGVYARRYSGTGTPLSGEFRVNTFTTNDQDRPAIAMSADGDFVVAWTSYGQDGSSEGVYAQRYLATGARAGGEFRVNTFNTDGQSFPTVAADSLGRFVIAWQSRDQEAIGTTGVFAQRYGNGPNPQVQSIQVNNGAVQRSRVTNLSVTFDAQVTFTTSMLNAFTLTRNGGGMVAFSALSQVVNGVTVVTISDFTGPETQSGSLRDGRYTLTALASQISAGGQQMAGDYTFGDAQGLFRFYGDINGDRRVDISDFGFFSLAFLQAPNYNAALDFNNDGRIDIADFGQFSVRFFTTLP